MDKEKPWTSKGWVKNIMFFIIVLFIIPLIIGVTCNYLGIGSNTDIAIQDYN
jgi:hypothetical protein